MEVPGRDVTADPLGPDPGTPQSADTPAREVTRPDAAPGTEAPGTEAPGPDAPDTDDREGIGDKVREVAEKVKDAVTPDDDKR
jgi:hypothetical protein